MHDDDVEAELFLGYMEDPDVDRKLRLLYENLEQKIKMMKVNNARNRDGLDKKKFKSLISEHQRFKMKNVRHVKFSTNATWHKFGRSCFINFKLTISYMLKMG